MNTERRRITVEGLVQGVGFRPFVFRIASERGLVGWVRNETRLVRVEVQGEPLLVEDFVSAANGGDIPEHRILYFRRNVQNEELEAQILWDRAGRVDRIFGSGNGPEAPVAAETLDAARAAVANMVRIE